MISLIAVVAVLTGIFYLYSTFHIKFEIHTIQKDSIVRPIKIVQISDLHGRTSFVNGQLSDLINACKPDYLVITGDLSNNLLQMKKVLTELSKINVTKKILVVLGNYEREKIKHFKKEPYDIEPLLKEFEEMYNLMFLVNSSLVDDSNGQTLVFYGFDNSIYGLEAYENQPEYATADFTTLLSHSPNIIKYIDEHHINYDLLLTGHTHGNQVNVPVLRGIRNAYKNYHIGMKTNNGKHFYISRGLGTARIPLRVNSKPEITIIDLERTH